MARPAIEPASPGFNPGDVLFSYTGWQEYAVVQAKGLAAVTGFLVGQVIRASRGQAKPQAATELLQKKLG